MIKTVSEFLERLREAEHDALQAQNITHRPTIGDMYEGLTQELLDRALPVESGIEVSAGFITDDSGALSHELDCLVVTAPGTKVPYTDKQVFHIDDVVAVVQVKKNLYSGDLRSGFENLASVNEIQPSRDRHGPLFRDAYQATTQLPVPSVDDWRSLPHNLQMVYYTLAMELYYPARIIFGYNGFKSQSALRKSFIAHLESQRLPSGVIPGLGIHKLPTLICCGEHSLAKANGAPFCTPFDDDGYWPVYGSTTGNPLRLLLEVVWTRLVYDDKMSGSVFDDDDETQPMHRLIDARPCKGGWEYRISPASRKDADRPMVPKKWQPAILDVAQFTIVSRLAAGTDVSVDSELTAYLEKHGYSPASFSRALQKPGLAVLQDGRFVLLTRKCMCAVLPDGRFAAADDEAGQFTRWIGQYMENRASGA
ncbi:MAG: hypothetical protein CVT59_08355 [Actinobacteria bacterium HGW-Actinobacteria-1]|nr:MAG: hypothetical protein CVT59_08355 [Actinobacteria bacterium HGW-Actinobacteria-1]